jgi:hypothetical protein
VREYCPHGCAIGSHGSVFPEKAVFIFPRSKPDSSECCIINGDKEVNKSNTNMNIERKFALALMAIADVIFGCATKGLL